jgi:hypothetical protein
MHLNRLKQLMRCYVNENLVHVNSDTDSEVDLMLLSYARETILKIETLEKDENWVHLVDECMTKLLEKTQIDLNIFDDCYKSSTSYINHSRTFYILNKLLIDVLLEEVVLYNINVFILHKDSFVISKDCEFSVEIYLITWFDKRTRQMSNTLVVLFLAKL